MYEMSKPSMGPKLSELSLLKFGLLKAPSMAVSLLGRRRGMLYTKCASSVEAEILTPPALTSVPSTGCSLLLSRG